MMIETMSIDQMNHQITLNLIKQEFLINEISSMNQANMEMSKEINKRIEEQKRKAA